MNTFSVYLIDRNGHRADRAVEAFTIRGGVAVAALYCERRYPRFIIVDAEGSQAYASNPADETAGYLPHEQLVRDARAVEVKP